METGNQTQVKEFILTGLTDDPALQVPLFIFFLLIYIITLLCNIGIITLITLNRQLHTPMYFLLCNLSVVDIGFASLAVPNMLGHWLSGSNRISFPGCVAQLYFSYTIGSTEVFLLAVMAYDRYIAICNPLLYSVIMNNRTCMGLVFWVVLISLLNALIHTTLTFTLPFCKSNQIPHFFCDVPPILKISCSDTTLNELVLVVVSGGLIVLSLVIVLVSYAHIVSAILRIRSAAGRQKTFSTCSAHFVCVTLFFGTLIFVYAKPSSSHSMAIDRVVSVFYMSIIPMLNPMIYSLRNKEMKNALRKGLGRTCV
ncbi:olfactory receptor 5AP2-like [Ambystoma mexicanum]|uniref:olfactory receptor 5AP2-like n=1 Tax=Ambystoma mexicanum TaxID=8296 RepID=UPI0037E99E8F